MKAILWTAYGPPQVLQLGEVDKPSPRANEVLVKVRATTAFAGDCEMRNLKIPVLYRIPMRIYVGFRRPKRITILGQELSGEVESVGKEVSRFKPGDQVFGTTGFRLGAYAEYACLSANPDEGTLAIKPANMTFEEAAAVPVGGLEALYFIRQGHLRLAAGFIGLQETREQVVGMKHGATEIQSLSETTIVAPLRLPRPYDAAMRSNDAAYSFRHGGESSVGLASGASRLENLPALDT